MNRGKKRTQRSNDKHLVYALAYLQDNKGTGYIARNYHQDITVEGRFDACLEIGKFICDELLISPEQFGNLIQEYIDVYYKNN